MERGCTPLKRSLRPVRSMYYVYIYIYTTIHLQDATSMFSLNELFLTRKRRGGGGGGIFTRWKYERNSRGISGRVSVTCSADEDGWNAWRFFFFFRSFSTASATTTVFWNVEQVISQEICIWNGAMIGIFSRRNREGIIYKFHEPPILIFFLSKFRKFHEPSFMLLIG